MGDALAELELVLRSSKEKLTREEEYVLQSCKGKALRSFVFGACLTSAITWTATRRLTYGHRLNLSGGTSIVFGLWRFDKSLDSCLDRILSLEGSRIQRELAKLILTKYQDHPWRMQLVKKHFYSEKVFNDSSPEKPMSRWRQRHFYGDITGYRPYEDEQEQVNEKTKSNNVGNSEQEIPDEKRTSMPNENPKIEGDFVANPLDCVLGYSGAEEERIPESVNIPPRGRNRAHRKSHRKKRHAKDVSLGAEIVDNC